MFRIFEKLISNVLVYILATAGLRFLPLKYVIELFYWQIELFSLMISEQNQILEDLFKDIERDYDFEVEKTHFQVISGELEGIYSWIAINYVLGRFQYSDSSKMSMNWTYRKCFFYSFRKSTINCRYSRYGRCICTNCL